MKTCLGLLVVFSTAVHAAAHKSERGRHPQIKGEGVSPRSHALRGGGRRTSKTASSHPGESKKKGRKSKNPRGHRGGHGGAKKERVFVKFRSTEAKTKAVRGSGVLVKEFDENMVVLEVADEDIALLHLNENIESVETDNYYEGYGEIEYIRNRSLDEEIPWGLEMIQANLLDVGPYPVTVCLVDTGYAVDHPDLPTDIITGSDAESKLGDIWRWDLDFNGHGTHIAGTISAISGNGIGVAGAGRIPVHVTRGLDDNSGGFESDVIDAVNQCIENGAKIINLSLGGDTMSVNSRYLYSRVVHQHGAMVIAAAGNQGQRRHAYPASHPDVISVAAVYKWERFWEGSNYCDQVELAAPGYGILSTTTTRSAVHTSDFSFPAEQVKGSRTHEVSGKLTYCGPGNFVCTDARGGVCLMVHDETDLRVMMTNCMNGGARGGIIFEANGQTIGINAQRIQIPTVKVPTNVGHTLMEYLGTTVSIGYRSADSPENTYAYFKGTSMAAPHVAAAAALVWSHFPNCTNHQIRYALAVSAKDVGLVGCDWDYGYGIVKARAAYEWLMENDCSSWDLGNARSPGGGCRVVA